MNDIDARQVKRDSLLEADVCIIGGGAAGITIAREFLGTELNVLLIESGNHSYDDETQGLYDFENVGHPIKAQQGYISRNRYLGGSTNTWHGRSAPLNDIDFQKRPWISDSGWPISKDELTPYYRIATDLINLPGFENFSFSNWDRFLHDYRSSLFESGVLNPEVFLLANKPINMRLAHVGNLQKSPNVQILINGNVTEIETNDAQTCVSRLQIRTLSGNRFYAHARSYVLACGGWENARLLLLSRSSSSNGLGNYYDQLGRYYMEHPKVISGKVLSASKVLRSPINFWKTRLNSLGFIRLGFRLADAIQEKEQLPNHFVELKVPQSMQESVATSESLFRRLGFSRATVHKFVRMAPKVFELLEGAERVLVNLPLHVEHISIFNHMEQTPNPDSRVLLSNERDALGQNRLKVKLCISNSVKESMVRFHEIMGKELERLALGNLISEFPPVHQPWPDLSDSSHHMGTTRMSADPRRGVVDTQCRVHGISNLFIASSSVFPTAGHVNPTLTIIALSLRLADYLKSDVLKVK